MFEVGQNVVYGQCGVCRIEEIGALADSPMGDRQYYTLRPYYSTEVIFAPVDGKVFMRAALDRESAQEIVRSIPEVETSQSVEGSLTLMRERYEASFRDYSCEDLVGLLKSIYAKNESAIHNGRRPGQMDQRYMKRAEDLLYGELAIALGIPREEVPAYIEQTLGDK